MKQTAYMTAGSSSAGQADLSAALAGMRRKEKEEALRFLDTHGVYDPADITDEMIAEYRKEICRQYKKLPTDGSTLFGLEHARNRAFRAQASAMIEEAKDAVLHKKMMRKTAYFLASHGICSFSDISLKIREQYAAYLSMTGFRNASAALHVLDLMKLLSLKENTMLQVRPQEVSYEEKRLFLLYYPDYAAAVRLIGIRNKEELIWDFTIPAAEKVKRQVFLMIRHMMREDAGGSLDRFRKRLIALKTLYRIAAEEGWEDVERLTPKEEKVFRSQTKDSGAVILNQMRSLLFTEGGTIHWHATIWYIDRLGLVSHRINPATACRTISFGELEDASDRMLLQNYMRYLIGITDRSVATIKGICIEIRQYMRFLEENRSCYTAAGRDLLERYLAGKEKKGGFSDETVNAFLSALASFQEFCKRQDPAFPEGPDFRIYKKKTYPRHNDRIVSWSQQEKQLHNLRYLPSDLRLMYLHLWALGLRANEVCTIRADGYFRKDDDFWLRIYQNKMKAEKVIPIPEALYYLMIRYIKNRRIAPDAYVFTGRAGAPYTYGTLESKLKEWTKACGCETDDYTFRSHDFRHTLATRLHEDGCGINLIRDYLGHKESDMTKQYIDDIPASIVKRNREYFKKHSLSWEKTDG